MAFGFSIPNIVRAIRPWKNSYFFETWGQSTNYEKAKKLRTVLDNPAALFLFALLPDLASMGEYKLYKRGDEDRTPIDEHPILDALKNPNPMQTEEQFRWDYMFWRLLGCASMLSDSKVLKGEGKNTIYWLVPDFIKWPRWFEDNKNTLFFTPQAIKELEGKQLTYKTENQEWDFKYGYMKQFFDLSNGVRGWFTPPSRVDALHKIVKNSDNVLDSKNTLSLLARKFMVSGKHDVSNTSSLPMAEGEKRDIETKILSRKTIYGMRSMVDIKRFVEDFGSFEKLDKAFMNDAFLIGKMLNIPKDVIESFEQGSTYENQEKGRAAVISYCIQPAFEDFAKGVLDYFNVHDLMLEVTFDHLPFVQTFEKDKAETMAKKASAFKALVEGGVDQQQAADECGLNVDIFTEPKNLSSSTSGSGSQNGGDET